MGYFSDIIRLLIINKYITFYVAKSWLRGRVYMSIKKTLLILRFQLNTTVFLQSVEPSKVHFNHIVYSLRAFTFISRQMVMRKYFFNLTYRTSRSVNKYWKYVILIFTLVDWYSGSGWVFVFRVFSSILYYATYCGFDFRTGLKADNIIRLELKWQHILYIYNNRFLFN